MHTAAAILLLLFPWSPDVPGAHPGAALPHATDWADYSWPTASGHIVTSTFGEYRRAHFHAGIDISSGDITGYPVFAARAGFVSRIRISPTGYGKMLYLRHPDGYTTTYAHLDHFAPALDERAGAEQRKLGCYPVDIACGPGEFPVRKGETIGVTGQTGAASPHLHFEIRDPDGNPVNPFLAPTLCVRDTIPPSITHIAVSPVGPEATVDGGTSPRVYRPETVSGTVMRIPRPIVATGNVGFAVEGRDRIPGSRFRNGVYARTLFIDGAPAFSERMDRTPWTEAHEIDLCYEQSFFRGGRFAKLYMDSPSHITFYSPAGPRAGTIDAAALPPGPHQFRIVCADFQGNSAEVTGTIVASRVPSGTAREAGDSVSMHLFDPGDLADITLVTRMDDGSLFRREWRAPQSGFSSTFLLPLPAGGRGITSLTLENRWGTLSAPLILHAAGVRARTPAIRLTCEAGEEIVSVRLFADGALSSPPSVAVEEGTARSAVIMSAVSPEEYRGWFRPREEFRGTRRVRAEASSPAGRTSAETDLDFAPVLPGTSGVIASDGEKLLIAYDSLSVLKPLFLTIEKRITEDGTVYSLGPATAVLGDGLTVSIRPEPSDRHRGLFRGSAGSWQFIGPTEGEGRLLCSGRVTGKLGDVTLLADSTPPSIGRVSAARGKDGEREIAVRFSDDLSGVEYDSLKMYIDGNMVIPDIDGRRHRAVSNARATLGRGSHRLTMRLTDRMGNTGTTERRFVLP